MVQRRSLPTVGRATFIVTFIAETVIGILLLTIPSTFGASAGYPSVRDLEPPIRVLGAAMIGLGGVTSLYGLLAKSWERVDLIVRGQITYQALVIVALVFSIVTGSGPAQGNAVLAAKSVVLLALFVLTWTARPRAQIDRSEQSSVKSPDQLGSLPGTS